MDGLHHHNPIGASKDEQSTLLPPAHSWLLSRTTCVTPCQQLVRDQLLTVYVPGVFILLPCYSCLTCAQVVAKGAADLDAALTFAAAIGSQHLCGILYSALAKYTRPPTPQGRKNCARELRQLATKAEDLGIKVCLEVVNRSGRDVT